MLNAKLAEMGPEQEPVTEVADDQAAAREEATAKNTGGDKSTEQQQTQTGTLDDAKKTDTQEKREPKAEPTPEAGKAETDADLNADGKPKSKWQKEQERLARNRREFEDEKKREREAIKAEKEKLAREQQEWQAKASSQKADPSSKADNWEAVAKVWENEGRFEDADMARAEAKRLREAEAANPEAARQAELETRQQASWQKAKQDIPEMFDPANPMNAAVKEFLSQNPQVLEHPNGPYLAAQHVRVKLAASRVPELEKQLQAHRAEVEKLQAKIKEQEALLTVSGGGPTAQLPLQARSDDDLSDEELRQLAMREAQQA